MVKLEELKKGDIVYGVAYDKEARYIGIYNDIEVKLELCTVDYLPPVEGVYCSGGIEILTRSYEQYLFRTKEERDLEVKRIRQQIVDNFMYDDFLKKKIFEKATTNSKLDSYYRELFGEIFGIS